ncbi:hypothetical protein MWH25_10120 [Natroniella acetigena]|uniref:hypothetical protein n=1 Tax=Natroniella acetigena TaxID=52004 RepID=UPI00200B8EA4|nr:hypothetical protein [Natroniella acetigena]MCK8828086.1 hypothetical protein [Natroniella acetigena]
MKKEYKKPIVFNPDLVNMAVPAAVATAGAVAVGKAFLAGAAAGGGAVAAKKVLGDFNAVTAGINDQLLVKEGE